MTAAAVPEISPPAHRDQHQVQVAGVVEQLQGGRALPGHDVVVVEGVDQVQAAVGGQVGGEVSRFSPVTPAVTTSAP